MAENPQHNNIENLNVQDHPNSNEQAPILHRSIIRAQKVHDPKTQKLNDGLDYEYRYYINLIPTLIGQLGAAEEKNQIIKSIDLLVDPTICTEVATIRAKRNRYLCMICVALLNNDVSLLINLLNAVPKVITKKKPTFIDKSKRMKPGFVSVEEKSLPEKGLSFGNFNLAMDPILIPASKPKNPSWVKQGAQQWEYYLSVIEDNKKISKKKIPASKKAQLATCSVHDRGCEVNKELVKFGTNLDIQFTYLLYLSIPHITQLESTMDLPCVWVQALCEVDKNACFEMKAIRNEYMNLLVGYLANKHICGPFEDLPTKPLEPLRSAANMMTEKRGLSGRDVPLNPLSGTVEAFMNEVPIIEEGAFAFLALTGNMIN